MDPADEEPGLPSAVKELILRLEGRAEPLRWLPTLSSPYLQEFFPECPWLSKIIGWRREVRLRVLEAIGSCNTFHSLDVHHIFGGDISRLMASEWELLLRGFRRSTVLRAIRVDGLRWRSLAEVESLCSELGEILKTSSVKDLTIVNCRLSAACFLNLASGLRGNDESKLESLELRNAWEDSSAVRDMADMTFSATRLKTLEIGGSGGRMYDMDKEAARTLSQALIKSSSLKKLVLNEVKDEFSAFLLKALDGDDDTRAIECLHLISVSGLGDCLRDLLISNTYLKEVTLTAMDMHPEEWSQLGEAIREDATARTIRVIHFMDHKDSFTEKGVEELACAASSNDKDPRVELNITIYDYDALMSTLNFVSRVLCGNIKSLESLILFLVCSCPSGSNHDRLESIVPMDVNPGETSVLERLRLYVDSRGTLKGVWKYLLRCLRENTSVTHLDLSDSGLDDEAFRELMGLLQVNKTLVNIDVSRTAWAKDGKAALIQQALGENLPPAVKNLIRRLEDRAEPLRWLPTLSCPDFQEFFPERASLSTIKGCRRGVRLLVLEAIGSCNTFHSLDVHHIFGGDISRLMASEWELLLRGFRRSTVLRAIRVDGLRWRSLAEVESLCSELGEILKTSSVKDLTIVNCRLSAACFLNLASGLRGNDESKLESLELRNAWEDSSTVRHMADMIFSATRLKTLEIGGSEGRKYDMDKEAARTLSQALIKSWSLKKLVLKEVKDETSAFLLKALHGECGNRTVECLHLVSVSGLGDCLRDLLISNSCLKEVTLSDIDMRPEKWRQLGKAIREDATARTIRIIHLMDDKDSFTEKGVEELACAASSDIKDPIVELEMTIHDYDALMSALKFVGRVLCGNIKSLKSLILFLVCPCPSGSNQDRMEGIVPMDGNPEVISVLKRLRLYVDSRGSNQDRMEGIVPMDGNPGETSVLKRLRLSVKSIDTLKGVWKYLLRCLRENTSVTHLDLSDSGLDDEAFRELMGLLQVNKTLVNIDVSRTAWAKDGKAALIQQALGENLPPAVMNLIRRLEDRAEPLRWLPTLSCPDFQEFFPERPWLSTIIEWRREVRLLVLEAIGSCNTFHSLDVHHIFGGDISRLMASEWELLLRGFRRSTVLRAIRVDGLRWRSLAEVESLCSELGEILKTSSVKDLTIVNCRLSATCFLNLASGLRGNDESKLESLELRNAWEDSSAVRHMADMIFSATRLKTLEIGGSEGRMYDMDKEAARTLSQALIKSSSLKKLVLKEVKDETSAFLLKALDGDDGNRTIECLHLVSVSGLGDCLRDLLIFNPYLEEVTLSDIDMRPEKWRQLGQAILEDATARTIRVTHFMHHRDNLKEVKELACASSSDIKDPIVELEMTIHDYDALMSALNFVGRVLCGNINSLKSLILFLVCPCPSGSNHNRMEGIVPMDGNTGVTSVLKRLRLYVDSRDTLKGVWKYLLCCLRVNTSVTHLDLSDSGLDDEAFRELMGVLQVNLTLQQVDVSRTAWAEDGKAAHIQQALQENHNRALDMSVFREAKLTFGDAKAGRLFLCGSPLAGKTQLHQTLMRIVQGRRWLENRWAKFRTTRNQVEFLHSDEYKQISIWDLAGEDLCTLQNVLFPRTSNFCVFLFVYNPFCERTSTRKPDICLEMELEYWLSFITSCTRVTGHNLPQVLVVVSHKDKDPHNSLTRFHSIVNKLTKRFAKFVDVHPIQECCYIDARKKKQVYPLKNHIFHIFEKLLSEKSPLVPKLCFQLSSLLVTNTKEQRSYPLWSLEKFYDFCTPVLKEFISFSSAHSTSCIIRSIISYLVEVGSIVYRPNFDYIIVNPNWLMKLFDELKGLDQNDQAQESESSDRHRSYTSKDGFVSEIIFVRLMEDFLEKQPHGQKSVDRGVLENILINLDLCFKLEDTSQYFIPSFIPKHASMEEDSAVESMAWKTRSATSQFVGIRIQCQDAKTMSFTAAFFPRFQMFMRLKLISEMGASNETVTCSRHNLHFFLHDAREEVFLEQDRNHKYVDVLMLYSEYKSREYAVKFVMKQVVKEFISFCASSKGCPGVTLVLSVIQTFCVKILIPIHMRGAILIENLKSNFIRRINDKLEDIPLDKSHLEMEDELFNYEHPWPFIIGYTTQVIFERARDLLWESDVKAIVNEIRQKRMQQLESFQQDLIQQLGSLQQGLIIVKNDLIHSYPENENMVTNSNFLDVKDSNRPSSRRLSRASTSVKNSSTGVILSEIHQLREDLVQRFDGVDEGLRSVVSIVERLEKKVGQIISLQQELQSASSAFMSKVDTIIQYSSSFQQSRTPKRPYVMNDVGLCYRWSALHVGTIVRLHLMCESVTGYHIVRDQEGLKILLDLKNCRWIRKTIEISFKFMYYAVKAGLDVTLGLGQAISEWEDLKSDIVELDGISDHERSAVSKAEDSKELREAWLSIQQTLNSINYSSINYSSVFKLYQVKYMRLELGGHAWVCEDCMVKGLRTGNYKV